MSDFQDLHPGWCSPERCDINDPAREFHRGAHRSAPISLDLAPLTIGRDRLQVARAYLWQAAGLDGVPFLILESGGNSLSMSVLRATSVLVQLALLVGKGDPA